MPKRINATTYRERPVRARQLGRDRLSDARPAGRGHRGTPAGADGSVPGLGNVDPHGYVRLHQAAVRGDWAAARAEQDRPVALFGIVRAARPGTASAGAAGLDTFKTALMLRGIIGTNAMSAPMRRLDAAETAEIAACLNRAALSRV
jgi:4-hydroxy-tetrahydrodipicolinate synthase